MFKTPEEREALLDRLTLRMLQFNAQDPLRQHHLMKVHRFAQLIGRMERLDAHTQFVTECAALVHDIGIRPAEAQYGASFGPLQEQVGPAYAETMLRELGLDEADVARISYLVGHHHTYTDMEGMDYQILVEADFLVNGYEDALPEPALWSAYRKIFRTEAGKMLFRTVYLGDASGEGREKIPE